MKIFIYKDLLILFFLGFLNMNLDKISLRALEPSDIDVLLKIENDDRYWKYANRTEPYSRNLLQKYIEQQKQDIFEVRQSVLLYL